MRYAIIPEFPEDEDLQPLAEVLLEIIGLPEEDAHPASIERAANMTAKIYETVFKTFGVPTLTPANKEKE